MKHFHTTTFLFTTITTNNISTKQIKHNDNDNNNDKGNDNNDHPFNNDNDYEVEKPKEKFKGVKGIVKEVLEEQLKDLTKDVQHIEKQRKGIIKVGKIVETNRKYLERLYNDVHVGAQKK